MNDFLGLVITALISGLFATVITLLWQKHNQVFGSKMRIFETLMSYRYMICAEENVKALNSIDAIFYRNTKVRSAYKDFLNEAEKKPVSNNLEDKYLRLLEEVSKSLKLSVIHWDDIKRPYYPQGLAEKIQEEETLRKMQIQAISVNNLGLQNMPKASQTNQQLALQIFSELFKNPESLKAIMESGTKQK